MKLRLLVAVGAVGCALFARAALPESWVEGADVTVASGESVGIDVATPKLRSLTIAGTVTMSGWDACLVAETVTVQSGGIVTCAGPATGESDRSRVQISCTDLTIDAGGKVDVNYKGYQWGCGPAWASKAPTTYQAGSHGGVGGNASGGTYDSVEEPTDLGSGGGVASGKTNCEGGGAVKIAAAGGVLINGTISADGRGLGNWCGGSGAGGSVLIDCQTIDGVGKVSVNGGSPSCNIDRIYTCGAGGGGRVSVRYDATAQEAKNVSCRVVFEANGGKGVPFSNKNYIGSGYPYAVGAPGTLYFTDNRFLTDSSCGGIGWQCSGVWSSGVELPDELSFESLAMSSSHLDLSGKPGLALKVTGDMTLTGDSICRYGLVLSNATLAVGGNLKVRGATLTQNLGSLTVGGDLTLEASANALANGGRLMLRAASTNGTNLACGFAASVAGKMKVCSYSTYSPCCHGTSGSIVKMSVGSLLVEANGWINADDRGWAANYGFGCHGDSYIGSTHVGTGGGYNNVIVTRRYDVKPSCPRYPGSGGSKTGAPAGGGVVWIEAAGTVQVNGKVSANANVEANKFHGAASGGTVFLTCAKFLPSTGTLSANGGKGDANSCAGGGGAVCVLAGCGSDEGLSMTADAGVNDPPFTYVKTGLVDATSGSTLFKVKRGLALLIR